MAIQYSFAVCQIGISSLETVAASPTHRAAGLGCPANWFVDCSLTQAKKKGRIAGYGKNFFGKVSEQFNH
jgi:hypothetical protein